MVYVFLGLNCRRYRLHQDLQTSPIKYIDIYYAFMRYYIFTTTQIFYRPHPKNLVNYSPCPIIILLYDYTNDI